MRVAAVVVVHFDVVAISTVLIHVRSLYTNPKVPNREAVILEPQVEEAIQRRNGAAVHAAGCSGLTLACKKVTMKALLVFLLIFVLVLETMAANGKLFTGTVVEEEKKVTGTTNRRLLGEPTDLGRKVGGGKGTDVKNDDDDNKNDSFGNYDQGTGLYTETHHRFTTTTNPIEPSNHN
ncbi:hypothetical protein HS088_TW14G01226 [Tripterygium wilfordii]|uniref:Uncharacterized protein n=1 Tax=Tripterygium wilfordii TaxID=458696 RepID=A0A7J7CSK4_TRIWF|nr:hypothetical protein HS088_TW14G01226 [Tripterygium wilfordii]